MKRIAWILVAMFSLMSFGSLAAAAQERVIYSPRPVVAYRPIAARQAYIRHERRAFRRHERRELRRQEWRRHERREFRRNWR